MDRAKNPAGSVAKEDLERPDWHILEQPGSLRVVGLASLATFRAFRLAAFARLDVNNQGIETADCCQPTVTINERLETFDLVQ